MSDEMLPALETAGETGLPTVEEILDSSYPRRGTQPCRDH